MALNAGDVIWTIGANLDKFKKAMNEASKQAGKMGKSLQKNSKQIGVGFAAAGGAITLALGKATGKSLEFSKAMANVNTLGVKDLGALSDAVKETSSAFGLDLVNASDAAYQAISAGASEAETPLLLEKAAIAATAGVSELSTAIELGTSVTNAFGMGIQSAGTIFDQAFTAVKGGVTTFDELSASVGKLSPIMSAAGLSSGEMFASIGALTKGGIATAESVTGMKAVMQAVLKPTSDASAMAEQLGIQFDITALKTQGLGGFMNSLKEATGGNVEQMGAFFASSEALGAALALTGNQAASFNELLNQMSTSTGASTEAFNAFVEANPGFALEQLKSTVSVLAVEIGDRLAPLLKDMAEKVTPIIKNVIDWIKNNQKLTGNIVMFAAALGGVMLVLAPLFIMLPGIVTAFGMVTTAAGVVGGAIAALSAPILLAIAAVVALAAAVVYNWDTIKAWTVETFGMIGDVASRAWGYVKNAVSNAVGGVINSVSRMIGWIKDAIEWFKKLFFWQDKADSGGGGGQSKATGGLVKGYASGGQTRNPIVKVGERGSELAALPVGTRVLSHPDMMRAASQGMGGGGGGAAPIINNTFTINGAGETDPNKLMDKLKAPFSTWMRDELVSAMR